MWREVWDSPMAAGDQYMAVDVEGLILLVDLVHAYWAAPVRSTTLAAEIRQHRTAFGLTPIDRRRLQWEVDRGRRAPKGHAVATPPPSSEGRAKTAPAVDPRRLLELVQ